MKTTKITNVLLASMLLLFTAFQVNAQRNEERLNPRADRMQQMLDLTEDQETKIEALRTTHMKGMLQFKNKLNELKAKQQTLVNADKADMKVINANIDEITALENKMMKQKAGHHQAVRALLNDRQRIIFDSHGFGRGLGHGFKHGHKGHQFNDRNCRYFYNN